MMVDVFSYVIKNTCYFFLQIIILYHFKDFVNHSDQF